MLLTPFLPLFVGVACLGHSKTTFARGNTVETVLESLRDQFCGCTHVHGNIRVNMNGLSTSRNLTEDDFSIFYHLEQISGHLFLHKIPDTIRIILPNLRIIRGLETESNFALVLLEVNSTAVIFPKLTEISRGGVMISDNPLCNMALVLWGDIIDGDGSITHSFSECGNGRELIHFKLMNHVIILLFKVVLKPLF
jgi:hypothetical protein